MTFWEGGILWRGTPPALYPAAFDRTSPSPLTHRC